MKGKMGKSICIYSPKGGTGKTIISANLGACSHLMGKKVLLIDFDLYNGTLSMFINSDIKKTIFNLIDDLNNNRYKTINDYVYKYNENIDILCSPKDPRQGSKIDSKYIEVILERVSSMYDLIIIDTYPNLNEVTVSILDSVDRILFVIDNDMFTIKNMKNVIAIFNDNGINNYKILLNNSIDAKLGYFSMAEIKKIINSNIDYTISKDFFIKEISSYIYDNVIPVLHENNNKKYKKDINNMSLVVREVLDEEK